MHRFQNSMLLFLLAAASPSRAQVTVSVDRLDGADPGTPAPAGRVVVDVFADVAATDTWTAAGLRATAANGAVLVYASGNKLVNPSLDDPAHFDPFVTCVSKPLERGSTARFFNAGAAVAGRFDPTGSTATATASEVNIVWFASPPVTAASPSQDGYIARVVIDVTGVVGLDPASIAVGVGPPPQGSIPLLVSQPVSSGAGTAAATFDVPTISGIDWNIHASGPSPEPTVFRYSFSNATPLPVVPDRGPAGNAATAGPAAVLSIEVPPDGPASGGNRSLDCRRSGAVTDKALLLSNDAVMLAGGFTMEAFFKWNGGGTVNSIIDYAGTEKLVIDVRPGGAPRVAMRLSGAADFPIGPAVRGQWQYVAAVFEALTRDQEGAVSGTLTLYLDSVSAPSIVPNAVKSSFGDSLVRGIGVGQHPLGFPPDFFDGLVHEPRVSLRPLKPGQLLLVSGSGRFRRGDANGDASTDIADAVSILAFLFTGGAAPACDDAADGNDDGEVDISDALAILGFLFLGSAVLPAPGPITCGVDSTPDALEQCGDPKGACE